MRAYSRRDSFIAAGCRSHRTNGAIPAVKPANCTKARFALNVFDHCASGSADVVRRQTDRDVAAGNAVRRLLAGIRRDVAAGADRRLLVARLFGVAVERTPGHAAVRLIGGFGAHPTADLDAHVGAGHVIVSRPIHAADLHVLDRLGLYGKIGCLPAVTATKPAAEPRRTLLTIFISTSNFHQLFTVGGFRSPLGARTPAKSPAPTPRPRPLTPSGTLATQSDRSAELTLPQPLTPLTAKLHS